MNWMLLIDVLMTLLAIWLVGHIIAGEYINRVEKNDAFSRPWPSTLGQRLMSFTTWWYVMSVVSIVYFTVRMFG